MIIAKKALFKEIIAMVSKISTKILMFSFVVLLFTLLSPVAFAAEEETGDVPVVYLYDDESLVFYGSEPDEHPDGVSVVERYTGWENSDYDYRTTPWYNKRSEICRVIFDESCNAVYPTSTAYWFYDLPNLETVSGTENLITSNVTEMRSMFNHCSKLTSLDVSEWDTSSVTYMRSMFSGCSKLTSIDVSGWDTSSVTNMSAMFYGCSSLTSIDVSGWDTSSVTDMEKMFGGCSKLTSIDLSEWDTSSVTNMSYMFDGCSSLTSLDVSGWDTSSVIYMNDMFTGCSKLTSIDVSGWDTSSVTDMSLMFSICSRLTSIDLSEWDTSSVTDMGSMFSYSASLTSIDVSGLDTSSVTDMQHMFYGCESLTTIYCSSDWSHVTNSRTMFYGCTKLVGGAGTVYDSAHTDASYARLDGGTSAPGYFTNPAAADGVYKINSIVVRNMSGNELQSIPDGEFLATVSITNIASEGDGMVVLATYTETGRYTGLMYVEMEDFPVGATLKLTLPVANAKGDIAELKAFVISSFANMMPIGNTVTFAAE